MEVDQALKIEKYLKVHNKNYQVPISVIIVPLFPYDQGG
jgi:hypothetical protein